MITLFLHLHFSISSSSPGALVLSPTRKCCSGGFTPEPSQEHKSSFIAFYCTVESTGWRALKWWQSLFFSPYWSLQQKLCSISPPAGRRAQWHVFFFGRFKLRAKMKEWRFRVRSLTTKKWKLDLHSKSISLFIKDLKWYWLIYGFLSYLLFAG